MRKARSEWTPATTRHRLPAGGASGRTFPFATPTALKAFVQRRRPHRKLGDRTQALRQELHSPPPPEREFASKPTSCDRRQAAREDGVYAPQIGDVTGGMGEDFRAVLPVFEQVGQSLLGPAAMRVDTPDEGDTYLLELHGTPVQQVEYHEPLAAGELNSGFPMNEPPQGAEAGPTMNKTTAERALSIVGAALAERQAFGSSLAEQGSPRFDIAEAEPDLEPNVRYGG